MNVCIRFNVIPSCKHWDISQEVKTCRYKKSGEFFFCGLWILCMNTFSWKSIQKTLRPVSHLTLKTASKLDQYICDRLQPTILDICETMIVNSAVHESTQIPPAVTSPSILPWVPVVRVTWNNWVSAVCHSPPSHESERTNTLLTFAGSFNPKCSIIVRLSHLTKFGSWSSRAPLGLLPGFSRPRGASLSFYQNHRVWTICFFHRTKQPNYWPELAASVSSRWNRLNIRL